MFKVSRAEIHNKGDELVRFVSNLQEIKVMATPGIVVNDQVVHTGFVSTAT